MRGRGAAAGGHSSWRRTAPLLQLLAARGWRGCRVGIGRQLVCGCCSRSELAAAAAPRDAPAAAAAMPRHSSSAAAASVCLAIAAARFKPPLPVRRTLQKPAGGESRGGAAGLQAPRVNHFPRWRLERRMHLPSHRNGMQVLVLSYTPIISAHGRLGGSCSKRPAAAGAVLTSQRQQPSVGGFKLEETRV